jgi:hypothetical protein
MVLLDTWQAQIPHFPYVLLISEQRVDASKPCSKEEFWHTELNNESYQIRARLACS